MSLPISTSFRYSEHGHEETRAADQLNWFFQIKEDVLKQEYYKFASKKNGLRYLFFSNLLSTLILLPLSLGPFVKQGINNSPMQRLTAFVVFITILLYVISGWVVYYRKSWEPHIARYLSCNESRMELFFCILQHLMIATSMLSFLFQFIRKIYVPVCVGAGPIIRAQYGDGYCLGGDVKAALVLGNALMASFPPLLFFATMPSTRIEVIWILIFIVTITCVGVAIHTNALASAVLFISWIISIVLVICDIQIRNFTIYLMNRKLEETVKDNERMADELHANEMRHMIGNVAHDLKTPLSSFTTGIEYIQLLVDEQRCKFEGMSVVPEALLAFINSVQSCLHNIRNTNSFMLMTINRCIDYTKASKGLKLVPRYETIDLMETLQLPISCMQSIQNRIEIKLQSMSREICSHVITDKQWLQENVLCLLSNAVKYSSSGSVTISITFVRKSMEEMRTRDPDSDRRRERENSLELRVKPQARGGDDEINSQISPVSHQPPSSSFSCASSPDRRLPPLAKSPSFGTANRIFPSPDLSAKNNRPSLTIDIKKALDPPSFFMNTSPGWLLFEIEDTGIGVPEEAMSTLFNPFKQTQRLAGGTGLGLYSLAKRIESLKGTYGVKERKDGQQGSLFWFTIPYRPDEMTASLSSPKGRGNNSLSSIQMSAKATYSVAPKENPPAALSASAELQSLSCSNFLTDFTTRDQEDLSAKGESQTTKTGSTSTITMSNRQLNVSDKLKILIVDDSPAIVKMTSMMLKKLGHEISSAENGEVAIKAVLKKLQTVGEAFDVILMDLQMPVMDGLEATRRLRRMERGFDNESSLRRMSSLDVTARTSTDERGRSDSIDLQQIPRQIIIGMSANSDHETTQAAYEVGVDAFLGKPFNVSTFSEVSSSLIAKRPFSVKRISECKDDELTIK